MEENPYKAPDERSLPPKQKLIEKHPRFKVAIIVFISMASVWMVGYEIFKGHRIAAVITTAIAVQCLWMLIRRSA